jgi:aminomethyltransferase
VTSGGFGVSLNAPIAMGYVPLAQAAPGGRLFAELRGRREALQVCQLPFVPLRYKR